MTSIPRDHQHTNPRRTLYRILFFSILAYSLASESNTLASSQIHALYSSILTQLPSSLRSQITTALQSIQRSLPHQQIKAPETIYETALSLLADANLLTLLAVVGPLLIFLFSMSHWWPSSGRYSPFTAYNASEPPKVTASDYSYLAGDDGHNSSHHRSESYGFPHSTRHAASRAEQPEDLSPDILILKHKGTTYPLHFPAFSIAESDVSVKDLRHQAAKQTKTDDPRRVKLLYKGRQLRDDSRTCKEEGLKQNSELMCVVSSDVNPSRSGGGGDGGDAAYESSSSASSSMIANNLDGPSVDVDGTLRDPRAGKRKNHRGGRKRKEKDPSPRTSPRESTSTSTSTFLSPNHNHNTTSTSTNGTAPRPRASSTSRGPSPAPPSPMKKPLTNHEMLDAIALEFNTELLPAVKAFMAHPPSGQKERDLEYKKLSETILAHVLLKLDAVETEGDPGLRARRKTLVKDTQEWLTDMDRFQGVKK